MAVIRFAGFAGENRALEPKLLPDSVCTISRNQKPGRGDLRPWKSPSTVATVPAGRQTIYRMGRDVNTDTQYWLSWATVVNAVRGFSATDTTEQTFYTGDGAPKFTNNLTLDGVDPQTNPTVTRPMGIPAPSAAPTAVAVASTNADAGKYVYTISDARVADLSVGDKLRITVGTAGTPLVITLTAGTGGDVTAASLATQINNLAGVAATVVTVATDTQITGVRVITDAVTDALKIEANSGTFQNYDPGVVTYTAYLTDTAAASVAATALIAGRRYKILTLGTTNFTLYGASANTVGLEFVATVVGAGTGTVLESASVTISAAQIAAIAIDQYFQVTVNTGQPVAIRVGASSGTFPQAVTADTVRAAFMGVAGITATIGYEADGVSRTVILDTMAIAAGALLTVRKINPATTDTYVVYASGTQVSATDGVTVSIFYVYTYVNDLGWESAPSPVSAELVRDSLSNTTLSGFATVPAGNYNVTTVRIYRTQTGSSGTEFYFLRDVAYGTASTTDDNRMLGEVLETTTWLPAPGVPTGGALNTTEPNLSNLTAMWNGMMAGITGNSVRVCEAYTPYAWPAAYDVLPPDGKPVALGVFGQSMLVLTTGRPLLVSGSSPDGLDQQPLEIPQGCVASRSAVSMGSGVAWASEDGLCWFGSGGARILTAGIMTREDWQALAPTSIIGQMYEGLYFGSYDAGSGRKGFMIDPSNPSGIYFTDTGYSTLHFDELKDQLYVLSGSNVQKWDAGAALTYVARSKVFKRQFPTNFGVAEVVASAYPVTFRLYADGVLKHTQTVTSRDPFRLPSGFRAVDFQIELEGTNAIQGCAVASEMKELAEV